MNESKRSRHIQRRINKESHKKIETSSQSNLICFKYGKVCHFKKDCKVKNKINNLNISDDLKYILCKVMLNSLESKSRTSSDNEDDANQLIDTDEEDSSQTSSDQEDCIKSNCDCQPKTINVIS